MLSAGYVLDPEYLKHDVMGIAEMAIGFVPQTRRMLPDVSMAKLTSELTGFR